MAVHTPSTSLSANDQRILNALFDPETLPSSVARSKDSSTIDSSLPPHPNMSFEQLSKLETQQNDTIRGVSSNTENQVATIDNALAQMDRAVEEWPNYPSAFVNRAMLQRMKLELEGRNLFVASEEDIERLFTDLSRAIHLSLPSSSPTAPVSPYQARILRTTYSHRAYLYLKAAENGVNLRGKGKSELEELASSDFAIAARYGDEVAREMSVRTNPYAKMCGAIVRNALAEERKSQKA